MSRKPCHLIIREHLLQTISSLPPNSRLPTEMELAAQFGVSRLTVHKVVMRLQNEGLVVRRRRGGTYVAREAHRVNTDTGRGRNGRLVIAYPNWFSYDIWFKVDLIERLALQQGLEPASFRMNPDTEVGRLASFCEEINDLAGIVIIPPGGILSVGGIDSLAAIGCAVSLLGVVPKSRLPRNICAISQDYHQTGYDLTCELLRLGHRRIGYLAHEPWQEASRTCWAGMRGAIRDNGRLPRALVRPERIVHSWEDASEAGYRFARELLRDDELTALVCDAFSGAFAALRVAREIGRNVPDGLSIVANAVEPPLYRYSWPRLARMAADPAELVRGAVHHVLNPNGKSSRSLLVTACLESKESLSKAPVSTGESP